ncbi:MAG: 4-hydroxythreonine-4-phosphate dehydrogenase PdxA [Rhodospirillales bacterium]|nr:4-hydroxythreonine-4-phosphate dehydrogenase PdxA [Rhodospirillales bacterium]
MKMGQEIAGVSYPVPVIDAVSDADWDGPIPILDQKNLDRDDFRLGEINAVSGKVTGDSLITCLDLCKKGDINGFVYAPLNKAAMIRGGYDFKDEFAVFSDYLNWTENHGEMNVVKDVWTTRVTSHIPIKNISNELSMEKLVLALELADMTMKRAGKKRPKIGVAALNPHCGEDGLCGREEIDVIEPAIKIARERGIDALGPFSPDTIFIAAFEGEYDAVTVMYHDQGQIALKLQGFEQAVTVSAGFPYAITTPAHGTAFDIVGKGVAKISATERAVDICSKMAADG